MSWNMAPECVSTVVLSIIWVYARKGNPIPSLKNRLFQICLLTTFCAMTSNILSALLIATLGPHTLMLTWAVTLFYFLATPLMGMAYYFYSLASVYEDERKMIKHMILAAVPGGSYVIMVLLDPILHNIFNITLEDGYVQGPYIIVTYFIFYLYCVTCVWLVAARWTQVDATIRVILISFPLIAGLVIIIQMMIPNVVLSGSAATCALLLIYLYLQNKQISIDYLTKIPNRYECMKMLDMHLRQKIDFSMVVVSLREFKHVNDTYGQHNGDAFLAQVSAFLGKCQQVRPGELYRYSGDEFALLLKGKERQRCLRLVEEISQRMKQPWDGRSCTCMLTAAVGVVHCPETSDQAEGLLNGIEYAVSVAKEQGGAVSVTVCTPQLLTQAKRRQTIVNCLRSGLQRGELEMYYQPIFSAKDERFELAEALMRLDCEGIGRVSPGEFIPIAEQSGLIVDLTYLALEKVCRDLRRLLDNGIELLGININLSPMQFTQHDLIERMTEIMDRYDISYRNIKVEITESTLAESAELVGDFINRMHEMGISIGLDDFGTGYSNLISVVGLPIDVVKLDKGLVWSAVESERFAIVMQNLARAFQELGITVLAEGVETEAQNSFVRNCGCQYIQGFLYAKPMPVEEFIDFLMEKQAALPDTDQVRVIPVST